MSRRPRTSVPRGSPGIRHDERRRRRGAVQELHPWRRAGTHCRWSVGRFTAGCIAFAKAGLDSLRVLSTRVRSGASESESETVRGYEGHH